MLFRRIASIYGLVTLAAGFLLMGWGPMFLKYFGDLVHADFGSHSLIRLAGVGFFLAGAALVAVRTTSDPVIQRRLSLAMLAAHVLGGLIVWAQQDAIWGTPLGWALVGWMGLASLSFAMVLLVGRTPSSASDPRVAPSNSV